MDLNEKLRVAWSRVEKDRRTDFLIGDFEYLAYAAHAGALLQELEQRVVEEAEFGVAPLRVIRVPKDTHSHTTRPGAVPEIDDRIVYQCLVDDIAEVVEPHLIRGTAAEKRAAKNRDRIAAERAWEAENEKPDPAIFETEILPAIQAVPTSQLERATGVSRRYISMVRRGERTPHPRHWVALKQVADSDV